MKNPIDQLPLPDIYYHSDSGAYYRRSDEGSWIRVNEQNAIRYLVASGYSKTYPAGETEADSCLLKIQESQSIGYAGPLAGFPAGPHLQQHARILVTSSPNIIKPAEGTWDTIRQMFESLLKLDGERDAYVQLDHFYGWLRTAYLSVSTSTPTSAQVLVLVGPKGGGKSMLLWLITQILGGRSADPFQFMTHDTGFNSDLVRAEHLVIDDKNESTKIDDRRAFGAQVKSLAVTQEKRIHPKGRDAFMLTPVWRISVAINDNENRIKVLPPLDDDIKDKLILFKAHLRGMPMSTETPDKQIVFKAKLTSELPAFIHHLLSTPIPEAYVDQRYGIKTYQHPDVVTLLEKDDPEMKLMRIIDSFKFAGKKHNPIEAKAAELYNDLNSPTNAFVEDFRDITKSKVSNLGSYLGRLQRKDSTKNRVTSRILHGDTIWMIQPPAPPRETSSSSAPEHLKKEKKD